MLTLAYFRKRVIYTPQFKENRGNFGKQEEDKLAFISFFELYATSGKYNLLLLLLTTRLWHLCNSSTNHNQESNESVHRPRCAAG